MKKMKILFLTILLLAITILPATCAEGKTKDLPLTQNEQALIQHLKNSIANAELGISFLPYEIVSLEGMSSPKVRHLLNNLCSFQGTNYLEIGIWKGSTWVSALYNNGSTLASATGVENWSQFKGPKREFTQNCEQFLKDMPYQIIEQDCFQVDLSLFSKPINIYFYDGDHSALSQEMAFTYFNSILDESFIAIVDDWNAPEVPEGTYSAFAKLNYEILFEVALPARWNGDKANWWNGMYAAVIRKKPSEDTQISSRSLK